MYQSGQQPNSVFEQCFVVFSTSVVLTLNNILSISLLIVDGIVEEHKIFVFSPVSSFVNSHSSLGINVVELKFYLEKKRIFIQKIIIKN